jgi:hypothetical protein
MNRRVGKTMVCEMAGAQYCVMGSVNALKLAERSTMLSLATSIFLRGLKRLITQIAA